MAVIAGTEKSETLVGLGEDDLILGLGGDDYLVGNDGNDELDGGDGDDYLAGNLGTNLYHAGAGFDTFDGRYGYDIVSYASVGRGVTVNLQLGTARAGKDRDVLSGIEAVIGTVRNDLLTGDEMNNRLEGGRGNDILDGGAGDDIMIGGSGNDRYYIDHISTYIGQPGDNVVELASGGVDTVFSTVSIYSLFDNVENLTLIGSDGISGYGNDANNRITGNLANNNLTGGDGKDVLDGGSGNDVLDGEAGSDRLTGGAGMDRFRLTEQATGKSRDVDVITDFVHGEDRIELGRALLFPVQPGPLSPSLLHFGKPDDVHSRSFVYDESTGHLYVGESYAPAKLFAILENRPHLTADDFFII